MKRLLAPLLPLLLLLNPAAAHAQRTSSPYQTRLAVDGPVILGLGLASATGLYLVQQKDGLTDAQLAALNKNDVPKFDRFSAGYYSTSAQTAGDLIVYPSLLVAPALLALNQDIRGSYGQVLALYLETMLATDATFTLTIGNVTRYRPFLYGTEGGGDRNSKISTNSFFAGHTAHTATATFFAAKVYHDFNPGTAAEPLIWTAAALVPAAQGYTRLRAGKHFLSDNIVGYAVGAASGILIPQLHKKNGRGLGLLPVRGLNVNGHAYSGLLLTKRL
ncbi:phosphatase PAP2 family protein [Hymenobacter sp. NST-14]|uniref:phosphatase PAP2 family protein n=1 Tax=Hymenobacter piscis TaxID=2839984 RepID=UPI001C01D122|nr:phosphatase PAP2 family protein [Hymenobacter piscis]MBT9394965.1 phosphatase PAP2 family protein [Hymenobacter piscis]